MAAGRLELPEQRPTPGQPVRLAPRPPVLAGREELLAALDAWLSAGDGPGPRTATLYGLGGAGKTSVALEYAYRHRAEVGVAWQFAAGDATVLAAGFGELAAQLGVRGLADTRDPVASVHAVLAGFPAPWLLIFDNAADMASVAAFLPPAGPGRVLITSQNPNWRGETLDVPVLDPEVAAGFLVTRTRDPDRQAALDLAGELGGLPLALEQAAAYMVAAGESLAGYLALFLQRRLDLLDHGEATGHPETVAATWALAFERLQHTYPYGIGLLRLMAFCAPEAVPLGMLLQPRPGLDERLGHQVAPALAPLLADPVAVGDAIASLRRYSLVTPAANRSASVHRLVQTVTADQMLVELAAAWQEATTAVIEAALPENPGDPAVWPVMAVLLPHAQAALKPASYGMDKIVTYLRAIGNYGAALVLQQQILDARQADLGTEDRRTLTARASLATMTGEAGNPAAARDQYAKLLPVMTRVLGDEHPDTLTARSNLVRLTGDMGDPAAALDQFAEVLTIRKRVLGDEHPDTLTARSNLARLTGDMGDPAAALDQFADLLAIRKRVLGDGHPDTLTARASVAYWTGKTGDPAAARDQFAELLPVLERVLGDDEHPAALTARSNLAYWTAEAGNPAAARDEYAALLPVRERVSSAEHPRTLADRASLADWTGETGDPAAARDQFAALLPVLERILGDEHPDTLTARRKLTYWTRQAETPGQTQAEN